MIDTTRKYELQYIKLGLPTNVGDTRIGHVIKTEFFDSLKELKFVIKGLVNGKGYENHGSILLSKTKQIKVNIKVD